MELTQEQKNWLDECTRGSWSLNKKGLVDIDGNFDCTRQDLKDFKGVKFGKVKGYFYCGDNKLTSLEGAPQVVRGSFYCNRNQLTSLVGAPQEVGEYFTCHNNQLTSLEGAPQEIGGYFECHHNQLTSLKGAPQEVGGFHCGNNQLTSLEGAPQEVGGHFTCHNNQLTSLEGAPQEIGLSFRCDNNPISETTLELIRKTMSYNKCDYYTALSILEDELSMKDKLKSGFYKGHERAARIMSRFV